MLSVDLVLNECLDRFLIQNGYKKSAALPSLFGPFVRTLVPFTHVRPTSVRNHFKTLYSKDKRIYPDLYLLPTYYVQVRHDLFLPLEKKKK